MAYNSQFEMTLQDRDGNYYVATLQQSATWSVTTTTTKTYLSTLPQDWQTINIEWNRHPEYLGVFRSQSSNGAFKFSKDARAIIQYIRRQAGIRGYGNLKIWIWNESTFEYDIWYQTLLDFRTYLDNQMNQILEISTLDSELIQQIQARGNTKFKIPYWTYDSDLDDWLTDAKFGVHEGIKLLYNATFISSATPDDTLVYAQINGRELLGFNHGKHFDAPDDGYHTIPYLSPYTPVQKDGSTTYVGNTILTPFLITGNQANGSDKPGPVPSQPGANERDFNGDNNSKPYTTNRFSLKNILPTGSGSIEMSVQVQATIPGTMEITGAAPSTNPFLGFVLFEIGTDDKPVMSGSNYTYTTIYKWYLTGASTPGGTISETITTTLSYNKVYVFALIFDDDAGIAQGTQLNLEFSNLQFSFLSNYDSGSSGTPIQAPSFPPSVFMGYRLYQVLQKIVPMLATTRSDDWGFPVPVATPYTGLSEYLFNDEAAPVADVVPFNILLTSSYTLQNLQGRSYMAISFNELFNFCKTVAGCAGAIEGDTFRIENFGYFFPNTMILDLGYDVTEFEIQQMTDGIGAQLKAGYNRADTNSNFGVDEFNTEEEFDTPAVAVPGTMDMQETGIVCGMYETEFIRQQQVTQNVTAVYDAGKPSANDKVVALYMESEQSFELPAMVNGKLVQIYDPENNPIGGFAYAIKKYSNAQSTDPTAATAPYVAGLYYPDTAINIPLSPCRNIYRNGPIIRSVLSNMDDEYLTFRNNTIIQLNNQPFTPVGISSNLDVGASATPYTEFSDIRIGDLPDRLFGDSIIRVRSKYPVNMYELFGNDPKGYVRFLWKEVGYTTTEYRFFIYKAVQVADGSATEFYGWITPDTVV